MITKAERDKIYWEKTHGPAQRIKRYGVTPDIFKLLLAKQGGMCGVCLNTDPGKKGWHIDHDHNTGDTRGILCLNCNVLLGHAKDNEDILKQAILYLRTTKPKATSV